MPDAALVIVPGHGNSGPDHWQSLLEKTRLNTVRVRQNSWTIPVRRQWVRGLTHSVTATPGPLLLIGHSLGAMTIVEWGLRHAAPSRVLGAILVAPPDLDRRLPGMPPRWIVQLSGWPRVPLRPLPFPSLLVASSDDPFCTVARAETFARSWGSRFIGLGRCGHINAASGFGPFPQLDPLIESMLR